MQEIQFANMDAFRWMWLALLLCIAALWAMHRQKQSIAALASVALQPLVVPSATSWRNIVRAAAGTVAFIMLIGALMDPRQGSQSITVERKSADIMFVIDASRSMLANDATPSRFEREKQFAMDAIDRLAGDRVGLIDFAGVASLRSPLTLNYTAVKRQIQDLSIKQSAQGGSDLAQALRLAAKSFPEQRASGRAIVILSDGEDLASVDGGESPVEVARSIWEEHGIRVLTMGLGDERDGARIPTSTGRFLTYEGEEVWTRMDSRLLQEIALAADGSFIPAGTSQVDLGAILVDLLADLERADQGSSTFQYATPRFQWPALIALVVLVAESLLPRRFAREGRRS